MPHTSHPRSRRRALLGTAAAAALCPLLACTTADASTTADATATARAPKAAASVTLPPLHAGFDYQIGQPYTPPAGVAIWPSFMPTSDSVVFHLETVYNGRGFGETRSTCDRKNDPCSDTGTRAELWWVRLSEGQPSATRLDVVGVN